MEPEEKFVKEILYVMKQTKERLLYTPKNELVEYSVNFNVIVAGTPLATDEVAIIRKLEEWGAFKVVEKYNQDSYDSYYGANTECNNVFKLAINQQKFDELYTLIEDGIKEDAGASVLLELAEFGSPARKDKEKTFTWGNLSKENLQIAQKVAGVTFNFLQFQPSPRKISLFVRVPLQKYENEQLCFDDVRAVLNRIDGIRVLNDRYLQEVHQYQSYQKGARISSYDFIDNIEAVTAHLPTEEELRKYVFLEVNAGNDLVQVKKLIDARLQVGPAINNVKDLKTAVEIAQLDRKIKEMKGDAVAKTEKRETEGGAAEDEGIQHSTRSAPHTVVKGGIGYFKFYKEGEKIKIGKQSSRHFRLLDALCNPHFGIHKIIESVFEAIKKPKDESDPELRDYGTRKKRMLTTIENTKKELQKNKELQRKIKYKLSERSMWLELEG